MSTVMPPANLVVSVVIPTKNRMVSLRRTLDSLRRQAFPAESVEVVVVADGCCDGTVGMLGEYRESLAVRVVELEGKGAPAARNRGAAVARGEYLLFLDDDMEAGPALIAEHLRGRRNSEDRVVMGASLPVLEPPLDFFGMALRKWWHDRFLAMCQPGHRFDYRDVLAGNVSLPAALFRRMGGFDPSMPSCREDYELGARLIKADAAIGFAPSAIAWHHDASDLDRSLRRARLEGRGDVRIAIRHAELLPTMQLAEFDAPDSLTARVFRYTAFSLPAWGDALALMCRRVLTGLEWARLRGRWRRLEGHVRRYWYWRGVAEEVGDLPSLAAFLRPATDHLSLGEPEPEVELSDGFDVAEAAIDRVRPRAVRVLFGGRPVGRIDPRPGAERLRGVHLRPVLATALAKPLLIAMAVQRACASPAHLSRQADPTGDGNVPKGLRGTDFNSWTATPGRAGSQMSGGDTGTYAIGWDAL
jgi:GT2 family glycosyltransferase